MNIYETITSLVLVLLFNMLCGAAQYFILLYMGIPEHVCWALTVCTFIMLFLFSVYLLVVREILNKT